MAHYIYRIRNFKCINVWHLWCKYSNTHMPEIKGPMNNKDLFIHNVMGERTALSLLGLQQPLLYSTLLYYSLRNLQSVGTCYVCISTALLAEVWVLVARTPNHPSDTSRVHEVIRYVTIPSKPIPSSLAAVSSTIHFHPYNNQIYLPYSMMNTVKNYTQS